MSDFDIDIKVSDAGAPATIGRVADALDRMEQKAGRAKSAANSVTDELARLKAESASSVSDGFLERQISILDLIRGPMREHHADMQALITMYQRGTITAREYTAEIEKMNRARSHGAGIGSGVLQGAGLGVLQGGAAGIAAAATSKAVEVAHEIAGMGDTYANLDNQLKKVSKTEEDRLSLLGRTKDLAIETRSEWDATNLLYVKLTNSTKNLGLTQERTLSLTETIAKAFSMSGASAEAQAGAMTQLSQAFGSGALRGDEFNSVNEAVPEILDLVAQQMGVTRGELKGLAAEGKITSGVLVASFEAAKDSIDAGFAKTTPTLSQSLTNFKTEMIATFGPLIQSMLPSVASALKDVASTIRDIAGAIGTVKSALDNLRGVGVGDVTVGGVADYVKSGFLDPRAQINTFGNALEKTGGASMQEWQELGEFYEKTTAEMERTGESFTQMIVRQGLEIATTRDQLPEFRAKIAALSAQWTEAQVKGDQFGQTVKGVVDSFDPWGEKGSAASQKIKAEVDKVVDSFLILKDTVMGSAEAFGVLQEPSTALGSISTAIGAFIADQAEQMKALKSWEEAAGRWKTGAGSRAKAWEPATNYWDNLAAEIKNAAVALQLFDTWADNSAEHYKELLDMFERQQTLTSMAESWRSASQEFARQAGYRRDAANDNTAFRQQLYSSSGPRNSTAFIAERDTSPWGATTNDANGITEKGYQQAIEYTKRWNEELEKNKNKWADVDKFGQQAMGHIEDSLVQLVETGKFSFKSLVESILSDLTRLAAHRLLKSIVGGIGGGGTASVFGTGATQAFQGLYGGAHATGGYYRAPMTGGGPDSVPVMFRMSPGELATFTPQGQPTGGAANGNTKIVFEDRRALTEAQEDERIIRVALKHGFVRRR